MVRKSDTIATDATFRVTPRLQGALQVLILAVFAFGHVSINGYGLWPVLYRFLQDLHTYFSFIIVFLFLSGLPLCIFRHDRQNNCCLCRSVQKIERQR